MICFFTNISDIVNLVYSLYGIYCFISCPNGFNCGTYTSRNKRNRDSHRISSNTNTINDGGLDIPLLYIGDKTLYSQGKTRSINESINYAAIRIYKPYRIPHAVVIRAE